METQIGHRFVGRTRQLAALRTALDEAQASRGQLVFVVGEPGIGKTRLAEEFSRQAIQRGVSVFWGRCWEGEGVPAFWPWVQIVRAYVQHTDPAILASEMGAEAVAIAQIVPELSSHVTTCPPLPELAPDQARFRFFDCFTLFLKRLAAKRPQLLILDDLHWADAPSLLLLQFLAREIHDARLLILGTYRDTEMDRGHPLSDVLGALARESHHLSLSGLTVDDVARFIESTTGITPARSLIVALHQKTEGNPFFLHELVRLLSAEGGLTDADTGFTLSRSIPHGVRETIRRRLAQLSAACTRVLTDAAVIGREFDLNLLEQVHLKHTSTDRGTALTFLHEALTARIISEEPSIVGRYRFVHALIRETLYEELPLSERIRLHRLVGEAIEKLYDAYLRPHLAALADHFFKAASGGDVDKAVRYAIQAGERAAALLAYEEAVSHYERALQILPLQASAEMQRGELLLALGSALAKAGEAKRARETYRQAVAIARALRTREEAGPAEPLLARAALGFAGRGDLITRFDQSLVSLLEEALTALPEQDSALRVTILARLATALYFSPFIERRNVLSQQAVETARRLGDPTTLAHALSARHMALLGSNTAHERFILATELIQLAEESGRKELVLGGRFWRLMDVLELGDLEATEQDLKTYTQLAAELRQPFYLWQATALQAMWTILKGRFEEGEQLVQAAFALGQRAQSPNAFLLFSIQLFGLRWEQGRLGELEDAMQMLIERYPALPGLRPARALLYSELGREAEARSDFEQTITSDFVHLPRDPQWLTGIAHLSQVAFFLNDAPRAAILYELLLPYAERNLVVATAADCYGSVARLLGLLATTMVRWGDAERHFEAALAMNARMGARPLVAHTQYEYAYMLLARDQSGDRERASELLTSALTTAQALGMRSLGEKIRLSVTRHQLPVVSQEQSSQYAVASSQHGKTQGQRSKTSDSGLRTPNSPVSSIQPLAPNTFRQEGDYWSLGYEGMVVRLHDVKGLHHLACLLREPGREFHVLDLLAMTDREPSTSLGLTTHRILPSGSQASLDQQARVAYRQKLRELRGELEEAQRFNDPTRAEKARVEIDFITDELATAYGLSHHARHQNGESEKARKAVTNRLRTVLTKIQKVHPAFWRHLSTALKTGTFCSYTPEKLITWQV